MLDPLELDNALSSITRTEGMWDLPPLPDTTKMDVASLFGTTSHRFMFSVQSQMNEAMSRFDQPDPVAPIVPVGSDFSMGAEAMGIVPSPGVTGLTKPIAGPTTSVMEQEDLDWLDTTSQMLTGVAGASLMPQHSRYQNQFDITQTLPYVRDKDSVRVLKEQAIELGLLPASTRIDGRWDPSMNAILAEMANEDFNRSMRGERPGAVSFSNALNIMGEALSPEFAFMVGREVVGNIAKGFWWNPGDIASQHRDSLANFRQVQADPDASTWDRMRAMGGVLFGAADDLVMPIINWGLTLSGVGSLAIFGRALFGVSAAAKAASGAKAYGVAAAALRATRAADVSGDAIRAGRGVKGLLRGFDEAAALSEMDKWVRTGRVLGKMSDRFPGIDPAGKLEAWRGLRGVMLGRKATQQMIRFNQSQLLMSAAGDNPADYYIEEARGRYDTWLRENIPAAMAVGVLSGTVMPRSIYQKSAVVARTGDKAERMKRLAGVHSLFRAVSLHAIENLSVAGEAQKAEALTGIMRSHGPVAAWVAAQHGAEAIGDERLLAEAASQMWEATVMAGVENRTHQITNSISNYFDLDKDIQRVHTFKARNKLLSQITEWDPENYDVFERKVQSMLEEAEYLGHDERALALRGELEAWAGADEADRMREFSAWALQANNNRSALIQDLLMPVYTDPSILVDYLKKNPTWMSTETYGRYHAAWGDLSVWVDGVDGQVVPLARGSRQAGKRAGQVTGQRLTSVDLQEGLTRQGVGERIPSLEEMLAPGGDDAFRAQVGMANPDLDTAIQMMIDGKLSPRSTLLNTPSMANVLYRDVDDPALGRFALARLETLTGNEAHVFVDSMHGLVKNLETFEQILPSGSLGALGAYAANARVNLSALGAAQFRRYVMDALNRAGGADTVMTQAMSTPTGVHAVQNLVSFLKAGNVDFSDLLGVHRQLDARVAKIAESDVWYSMLGAPDKLRTGARTSTAAHASELIAHGRRFANTLAQDVHEAPLALRRSLAHMGYKPVFGQEFIEPAAIRTALALRDKLPGEGHWGGIGSTALSMFMPDAVAQHALFRGISDRVGRVAAWAMTPGDRQFTSLYEKALKHALGRRLSQVDAVDRTALFGAEYFDEADIDELYRSLWATNAQGRRAAQQAHDDLTGFTFPDKVKMAFTPQTLRESQPHKLVAKTTFRDRSLSDESISKAVRQAIERAMQDALDPGRAFPEEAFAVRGPIQMAEDFLRAHGTTRGIAIGLPLLAKSTMYRTARAVTDNPSWYRALGTGAAATTLSGLNAALTGGIEGDDALSALALGGATALGAGISGRALLPAVGSYVGMQAMPGNQALGAGLGGLLGAASSLPAVRKMEQAAWGAGRETSTLGKVAGAAAGAQAGAALQPEGVGEDSEWAARGMGAIIGQFGAPALAAVGRPLARAISPNPLHQTLLELGRFSSRTMTDRAFNLTMALRFTLSPLFDLQRHTELASFSITKPIDGVSIPLRPMSQKRFIEAHGAESWKEWAGRYSNAGRRAHGGVEQEFEAGEIAADLFRSQGILGFNPTDKGISIFRSLVDQGISEDRAFRHAREILGYGVNGRSTGELTINAIFFPFSFQARYVGRWAKWLQDDALRGMMIAEGLRTYEMLDEKYDLSTWFEEHMPLLDQLNKINAFGFGLSPGELGGIHRPWINFFVPIATSAFQAAGNITTFRNPYSGAGGDVLAQAGEGVGKTLEENVVDADQLIKRIVPMWRDVAYLMEDARSQGHVIFSPNHLTREVEVGRAYQKWNAARRHAMTIAASHGYTDLASFSASPRGAYYATELANRRQELMKEFPAWEDSIEESVALNTASRFVLRQQAQNPTYLVDYDTANFVNYLDGLERQYAGMGYDFNDPTTLPESVFEEIRERALLLAANNNGFDRVWDKHYRKVWGPITRPIYMSMPVVGEQVMDTPIGEPSEEMRDPALLAGAET